MLNEPTNPNDNIPPDEGFTEEPAEEVPAEQSNNRTFWTIGGILGGLILLTLLCLGGYIFLRPRLTASRANANATATVLASLQQQLTATAQAALFTPTSQPTATKTAIPTLAKASSTPVVAQGTVAATNTGSSGSAGAADAATLAFLQTQLASAMTSTAGAAGGAVVGTPANTTPAGALAATGFFDQVGLPTLVVLTLVLLAVIFLARRLRSAPAR